MRKCIGTGRVPSLRTSARTTLLCGLLQQHVGDPSPRTLIRRAAFSFYTFVRYPAAKSIRSAAFSTGPNGWAATTDVSKPLGRQNGDYGWRVRDAEGRHQSSAQTAALSYRSPYGRIEAGASQQRGAAQGTAEFEGAVAVLGGGVYAANRIDDSFAVVDAGAPNIDVLYENRLIGRTNSAGRLLVPDLRSYQRNKIEIDPRGLPLDAVAATTPGQSHFKTSRSVLSDMRHPTRLV